MRSLPRSIARFAQHVHEEFGRKRWRGGDAHDIVGGPGRLAEGRRPAAGGRGDGEPAFRVFRQTDAGQQLAIVAYPSAYQRKIQAGLLLTSGALQVLLRPPGHLLAADCAEPPELAGGLRVGLGA